MEIHTTPARLTYKDGHCSVFFMGTTFNNVQLEGEAAKFPFNKQPTVDDVDVVISGSCKNSKMTIREVKFS